MMGKKHSSTMDASDSSCRATRRSRTRGLDRRRRSQYEPIRRRNAAIVDSRRSSGGRRVRRMVCIFIPTALDVSERELEVLEIILSANGLGGISP